MTATRRSVLKAYRRKKVQNRPRWRVSTLAREHKETSQQKEKPPGLCSSKVCRIFEFEDQPPAGTKAERKGHRSFVFIQGVCERRKERKRKRVISTKGLGHGACATLWIKASSEWIPCNFKSVIRLPLLHKKWIHSHLSSQYSSWAHHFNKWLSYQALMPAACRCLIALVIFPWSSKSTPLKTSSPSC